MGAIGVINGTNFLMYVNGELIAHSKTAALTLSVGTRDISAKTSVTNREYGRGDWEISGESLYQFAAAENFSDLLAIAKSKTKVKIRVSTQRSGIYYFYEGDGLLSTLTANFPGEENSSYTFNFKADNGLTEYKYSDNWFLPSKDEMTKIFENLFDEGLGDFSLSEYWTSSEGNAEEAWFFDFESVDFYFAEKYRMFNVRPCRVFTTLEALSLGDEGYGGGLIFHIVNNGGVYTCFEADRADLAYSPWSNVVGAIGTTSDNIGEGANNTAEIIAQAGHTASAAKLCDDFIKII